ncbi:RRQRL motif-containing zinc-binding protein [Lentzea sp. CA-135723]|uniref:RRQRL motif-containing zinc-binding protein n=1 Tax=Lentzea sp. CA-135723 TaxID=3239950 RepID=UPI003D90D12F
MTLPDGRSAIARDVVDGLPAFGWNSSPAGLLTRRQLADERLRPVGDPVALLIWGRARATGRPYRRWAALFPVEQACEKRPCTPGMRAAIDAALAARRVCQICGPVDHYVRTGLCGPCYSVAGPSKPNS